MSTAPAPVTTDAQPAAEASSRDRLRHLVTQGLKAAGFTAGGVAAGAVLEARTQLSHRLPIARPATRGQTMRKAIVKRLP